MWGRESVATGVHALWLFIRFDAGLSHACTSFLEMRWAMMTQCRTRTQADFGIRTVKTPCDMAPSNGRGGRYEVC